MQKPSGPQFQRPGEKIKMMSDRQDIQERLNEFWDIKLVSHTTEHNGVYDPKKRELVDLKPVAVLIFERNEEAAKGRLDDHFAAVYQKIHDVVKAIPEGVIVSTKLRDSVSGKYCFIPQGYEKAAHEVCTLRKYRKASPEVEALINEVSTAGVT